MKSRPVLKKIIMSIYAATIVVLPAFGQDEYPQTIWVPVIYYDFHANQTNPNFEPAAYDPFREAPVIRGMIQPYLEADRKPILRQNLLFNDRIDDWFRPQGATGAVFQQGPLPGRTDEKNSSGFGYWSWTNLDNYLGRPDQWVGQSFNAYDPMANVVIYDSLQFTLVNAATGTYQYRNDAFFPINNRGFGTEPATYSAYEWVNTAGLNYSFAMEIHTQFTYEAGTMSFSFIGDDDVWAFINGELKMDLGGIHGPEPGSFSLDGLGLVSGETYDFDFFYCERHVTGSHILITTNILRPNLELGITLNVQPSGPVCAGETVTLTAEIRDKNDVLHPEYNDLITWTFTALDDDGGTGWGDSRLSGTTGSTNTFRPTKAYTNYTVTVSLPDPENPGVIKSAQAVIRCNVCVPYKISIEQDSVANKWIPNPTGTINFSEQDMEKTTYAFIRDEFDNLFSRADGAVWTTRDAGIVTAAGVVDRLFQGTITRQTPDAASVYVAVTESRNHATRADSVRIVLANWYPLQLRLVYKGTDNVIPTLQAETDLDYDLEVQGEMSTQPGTWVVVNTNWQLAPATLLYDGAGPPADGSSWTYRPKNHGTGTLTLTHADTRTPQLVVPVVVVPSPPSITTISLVDTAGNSPTAGVPIKAKIEIRNLDGLYPLDTCLNVRFTDIVNADMPGYPAGVIIGNDTVLLGEIANVCFSGGIDTVSFLIYRADNKHDITITFTDKTTMTDKTDQFKVKPGPLAELRLEGADGTEITNPPDTVRLYYPDGAVVMLSIGYDAYGNRRGNELSNWTTTGTLHSIANPDNISRIYYEASSVVNIESGTIRATAASNPAISDWANVFIGGAPTGLDSAITRDYNGDGYLDAIELHFNRDVTIDPAYFSNFRIVRGGLEFNASRLQPTADGSVYILHLTQNPGPAPHYPQTAWMPYISFSGIPDIEDLAPYTTECIDGAGPVIWTVTKTIKEVENRTLDIVTVTFSEKVQKLNGSNLDLAISPDQLFIVYKIVNGDTVGADTIFAEINSIKNFGDTTFPGENYKVTFIEFNMINGRDLNYSNLVNIDSLSLMITDLSGNQPNLNNRKVRVNIIGDIGPVVPFPNPAKPEMTRPQSPPGQLVSVHDPLARDFVQNRGGGGTVLTFRVSPDTRYPLESQAVMAYIKIYDLVGNQVIQSSGEMDLLGSVAGATQFAGAQSEYFVDLYWNGTTSQGMPAAPGVYRAIVFVVRYADGVIVSDEVPQSVNLGIVR